MTAQCGRVVLVGAGPGDPELLTFKAAKALAEADVILVDELVNRAVLVHARPTARIITVGKRGGCRSTPQALIERMMIRAAQAGARVVRLKGGDPFLFGRGGEERVSLQAAGIAVEVVSGVTAGLAAPARLGIPVTHRDITPGVIFVTGHRQQARDPDWAALAATGFTLVIYMGVTCARTIAEALLGAGRASTTPVAVISHATLDTERSCVTSLQVLAADGLPADLASPAIIVIGEVANLADVCAGLPVSEEQRRVR